MLRKQNPSGPGIGVMAMLLGSHVIDRGLIPGPSGLNSHWVHVHACPRSQEKNVEKEIAAWPSPLVGDFSLSVSLSLSVFLASTHTLYKKALKKIFL